MAQWLKGFPLRHLFVGRADTTDAADTHEVVVNTSGEVSTKIADGSSVSIGAKADAMAATDTGTYSLIALVKRLLDKWTNGVDATITGRIVTDTEVANIAINESLSDEIDLGGHLLAAIVMPAGWDTADITFQAASASGGTFGNVYDDTGTEVRITSPAAGRVIGIDTIAGALAALRYIKIRSGTTGTPVVQTAARIVTLVLKG